MVSSFKPNTLSMHSHFWGGFENRKQTELKNEKPNQIWQIKICLFGFALLNRSPKDSIKKNRIWQTEVNQNMFFGFSDSETDLNWTEPKFKTVSFTWPPQTLGTRRRLPLIGNSSLRALESLSQTPANSSDLETEHGPPNPREFLTQTQSLLNHSRFANSLSESPANTLPESRRRLLLPVSQLAASLPSLNGNVFPLSGTSDFIFVPVWAATSSFRYQMLRN